MILKKRRVARFVVDGVEYVIEIPDAQALADRLHNASGGDVSSPAYGAAVIVDRVITDEVDESLEWHPPEKDALRRALNEWLDETGTAGFPDSLMGLRYAMFGELQDELPAGLYDFVLDVKAGEREKVLQRNRAPVPGQAMTIDGQTFIIDSVTPARGSEFVAVVRAHLHPG